MHEYSVADQLVKTLKENVSEEELTKTEIVHLRLGDLRTLSKEALIKAYQILVKDTPLQNSEIEIEGIPIEVKCPECGFEGPVEYDDDPAFHLSVPIISCPKCGGSVEVVSGRELEVRTLTLSEESEG